MSSPGESFWLTLAARGDNLAVVDTESKLRLTYRELDLRVRHAAERLKRPTPSLIMLYAKTDLGGIICYLAALAAGHSVAVQPDNSHQSIFESPINAFCPEVVLRPPGSPLCPRGYEEVGTIEGYIALRRIRCEQPPPDSALALLLATSASSGNSKSVRLSRASIAASAIQVADALGITSSDRSLMGLPMSYVYGLSILHSTLQAGGAVILTRKKWADRTLYSDLSSAGTTSVGGVTLTFEYLRDLDISARDIPTVRRLTHAGGPLPIELFEFIHDRFGRSRIETYLMYGQTEAGGRITVLPPACLPALNRSVGQCMRGGSISIGSEGEIIYRGPGVMMGYATSRADLCDGDRLGGLLSTGDTGHLDSQGNLFVTGRISRFCKVFGKRISLDDIESFLRRDRLRVAAVERDGIVSIYVEGAAQATMNASIMRMSQTFKVPPQCFVMRLLDRLPRSERGKLDYASLRTLS